MRLSITSNKLVIGYFLATALLLIVLILSMNCLQAENLSLNDISKRDACLMIWRWSCVVLIGWQAVALLVAGFLLPKSKARIWILCVSGIILLVMGGWLGLALSIEIH